MSALFWLIVRWIAAALIGIAVGSTAAAVGFDRVMVLVGAAALLLGGTFVFASIWAANTSALFGTDLSEATGTDLVGAGLLRATLLGFLGAGLLVGSLSGTASTALVSAATGAVALLLSLGAGPAEQRRLW